MGGCAVHGCTNHTRKNTRMFRFPSDPERRKIWIANCGRSEVTIPKAAYICLVHFDDQQFEQHREDGWKKLKPNAIPTLFSKTSEKTRAPKSSVKPKKLSVKAATKKVSSKISSKAEKYEKKGKAEKRKSKTGLVKTKSMSEKYSKSKNHSGEKRKLVVKISGGNITESSENSQKENVLPRIRKSPRPCKVSYFIDSHTSDEEEEDDNVADEIEEVVQEYKDTAAEQQITIFKREIDSLKQEISEFEKHNKSMTQVISELEKHNKLMSIKIIELEKENKVLTYKVGDLEKLNEDLKAKLDCSFTEEQLARMEKMRQLGTIERYIPALHQ